MNGEMFRSKKDGQKRDTRMVGNRIQHESARSIVVNKFNYLGLKWVTVLFFLSFSRYILANFA